MNIAKLPHQDIIFKALFYHQLIHCYRYMFTGYLNLKYFNHK